MKMKINGSYKVFYDNSSQRKFISNSKAFQERRTLEKGTKTAKFAHELLPHRPLRVTPYALSHGCGQKPILLVFQTESVGKLQASTQEMSRA